VDAKKVAKSALRTPVVGFSLDGAFILAESPVRCRAKGSEVSHDYSTIASAAAFAHTRALGLLCDAGADIRAAPAKDGHAALEAMSVLTLKARRSPTTATATTTHRQLSMEWENMGAPLVANMDTVAQEAAAGDSAATTALGLPDASTNYVLGVKTILTIPIVPTDGDTADIQTQSYPRGYNYNLVQSAHGSSISSYLTACMQKNSDYYASNSWNQMSFNPTITPVMKVAYTGATCGNFDALDFWNGKSATALDMMAFAAAEAAGYARANYDLHVIFIPKCGGLKFGGVGWVGLPGALQNSQYKDYDAAVAHEIGHNVRNINILLCVVLL
jgi:hypothetical protein